MTFAPVAVTEENLILLVEFFSDVEPVIRIAICFPFPGPVSAHTLSTYNWQENFKYLIVFLDWIGPVDYSECKLATRKDQVVVCNSACSITYCDDSIDLVCGAHSLSTKCFVFRSTCWMHKYSCKNPGDWYNSYLLLFWVALKNVLLFVLYLFLAQIGTTLALLNAEKQV